MTSLILLLRPESSRVFLSCANYGFCRLNLARTIKFKYESENEKDCGRSSKMMPSCKGPIVIIVSRAIHFFVCAQGLVSGKCMCCFVIMVVGVNPHLTTVPTFFRCLQRIRKVRL